MSEVADDKGWLEFVGVEDAGECGAAEARSGLTAAETAALVLSFRASRRDIFVVILLRCRATEGYTRFKGRRVAASHARQL